jgi:hypothetical protein
VNSDEQHNPTVHQRWLGSGHSCRASGRFGDPRAEESANDSKSAAQRWADARERVLLTHGKPKPIVKEEVPEKTTLKMFASRFLERYAKANRLKPSGIASKRTILDVHLIPAFGDKALDAIRTDSPGAESKTGGAVTEDRQQRPHDPERALEDSS